MPYELKMNEGIAFTNDGKTADKHPDFKGQINIDGRIVDVGIWERVSKKQTKYLSFRINEPYQRPESAQAGATSQREPVVNTQHDNGVKYSSTDELSQGDKPEDDLPF